MLRGGTSWDLSFCASEYGTRAAIDAIEFLGIIKKNKFLGWSLWILTHSLLGKSWAMHFPPNPPLRHYAASLKVPFDVTIPVEKDKV